MAIQEYAGSVISCLSTDVWPEKPDGWFLKELDTGMAYFRRAGVWEEMEAGLGFVKTTKSGRIVTDGDGQSVVVFNTPYVNDAYSVVLTCGDPGAGPGVMAYVTSRAADGFVIQARSMNGVPAPSTPIAWLATLDYNP